MKPALLIALFSVANAMAGVLFTPPETWVELETEIPDPGSIRLLEAYAAPEELPKVVITQFGVIRSVRDADSMMKGLLGSMDRASCKHDAPTATTLNGHAARRVRSEIPGPDDEPILVDTYVVFTSAGAVSVNVMTDARSGGREAVTALLERVRLPGEPLELSSAGPDEETAAFRAGTLAGRLAVAALVLFGIGKVLRARVARKAAM